MPYVEFWYYDHSGASTVVHPLNTSDAPDKLMEIAVLGKPLDCVRCTIALEYTLGTKKYPVIIDIAL